MEFIEPVDITPTEQGVWVDADLSSHVPAGTSLVLMHVVCTGVSPRVFDYRKNGSTDQYGVNIANYAHMWCVIGVDENRIIELWVASTTQIDVWLVGYLTADEGVSFTNVIDKTPETSDEWIDVDITSDVGGDTPVAACLRVLMDGIYDLGLRCNGSTETASTRCIVRSGPLWA